MCWPQRRDPTWGWEGPATFLAQERIADGSESSLVRPVRNSLLLKRVTQHLWLASATERHLNVPKLYQTVTAVEELATLT